MGNRVKAIVSYDGTLFSGYQVQPEKRTVQGELEKALARIHKGDKWKVTGSGRTDTGVHSIGQTIHFDTTLSIPAERWPNALNSLLPEDIMVREVTYVDPDFHARYDTVGKEYVYQVNNSKKKNIFKRNYMYHYPYELSLSEMKRAAVLLMGTHDYSSFSSPRTSVVDKVRTIFHVGIEKKEDEWIFRYIGTGFLYQMVRILTGTLLEVGKGKIEADIIPSIIEGKDRDLAGPTIPGNGLYLTKVFYEKQKLQEELDKLQKSM
ncbi:tRNA pseudouridine38-40 synthase [Evansella vedderi]|uniref:tRNA pseudouridine synthase A n=1 Tax=Evansella vedderi TaxID=38282 RepID=A0ABT9ZXS4_9BACI|nr:tRNA pseudouridine(38-40) synthase TruA [Evansella vedderi]MDQ0256037.1 tRNA pseudouridine38-40 synthase [Evansella vedderi]